ncbi:MAG: nitrite/sulfite reductase [Actinobacteria bacterium]|nr:nitrite/sulfite reductase [Actinomycetota bacterium]
MTTGTARERPPKPPPTEELVLKRNPVERLKREKSPLGILGELPQLIATGYADIPEEDIVRLKWWGLYHDKPKVGTFMLRIKLNAGRVTPAQLREIGEISNAHGKGAGELTTRQTIQLHYLDLPSLPDVFDRVAAAGLTTAGACGDAVRNTTGCPLAGVAHDELFDVSPLLDEVATFFYGNPDYSDLPRKHKISISACAHRCNAPEINCISLVGALRDGEPGFGVLVGGGLSSVPRIARELGVWVPYAEALEVLRAILDAWKEDLRYRVSRVKARLKFMVDDLGPEGMRAEVERRLGRALADFTLPPHPGSDTTHLGLTPEKRDGHSSIGIPVNVGLVSGDQMIAVANLAEEVGGDVRVTRHQNLILTGVPNARIEQTEAAIEAIGFPLDLNPVRGGAIACTGEPHCNFSVTETKTRLDALLDHLETRFGNAIAELRLNLDGCPHACGQHWVGDLGFQGSTARDEAGTRHQAYEIYVRGSMGAVAAIGRPVFRRVPTYELDRTVAGLVAGWLDGRRDGEPFAAFATRLSDAELGVLAGRPPSTSSRRTDDTDDDQGA